MVIPVFAIGAGLAALRSLRQRKQRKGTEQGIRGALDALISGTIAGELPSDQEGPPRPVGIGGNNLFAPQLGAVKALSVNSPAAALDMALQFATLNQQQQNFNANAGISAASFDLQRDQFELGEKRLAFDQQRLTSADLVTQQEREAAILSTQSPQAAEQFAANQDPPSLSYSWFDPVTQTNSIGWRRGSEPFIAANKGLQKATENLKLVNELRADVLAFGLSGDPGSLIVRTIESKLNTLQLEAKGVELFDLGAISESDKGFLVRVIPDLTSLTEQFTSNPEAIEAQLAQAARIFEGATARISERTRDWVGLEQQHIDAQVEQFKSQELNIATRSRLLAEAEQRRVGGIGAAIRERIGFLDLDERFRATFLNDEQARRDLAAAGGESFVLGPNAEATFRQLLTQPGQLATGIAAFFAGRFSPGR